MLCCGLVACALACLLSHCPQTCNVLHMLHKYFQSCTFLWLVLSSLLGPIWLYVAFGIYKTPGGSRPFGSNFVQHNLCSRSLKVNLESNVVVIVLLFNKKFRGKSTIAFFGLTHATLIYRILETKGRLVNERT